jgi:hypothetical protein
MDEMRPKRINGTRTDNGLTIKTTSTDSIQACVEPVDW